LHALNLSNLSPLVNLSGRQKFPPLKFPSNFCLAGQSREAGLSGDALATRRSRPDSRTLRGRLGGVPRGVRHYSATGIFDKIGSRKVYNYSTSSNLFGIKNMERFCRSQNRALIFAKTLSAYGGSREIP